MIIHNPVITGSLQVNGSSVSSIEQLDSVSGSVAALNNATSSYALKNSVSGSFTSLSSSLSTRLTDDEGSITSLNAASSSYLQNTTDTLTGDLTVTGTLTAQDLHVQEITSSIVYSSGSNIFGSQSTDTQQLKGSTQIISNKGSESQEYNSFNVADDSDTTKGIRLAYDTGSDAGVIAASDLGTGWKDILINPVGGDVGIGTTNPTAKVSIKSSGASGLVLESDSSNSANSGRIFFSNSSTGNAIMTESGILTFRTGATPRSTSGTKRLSVESSGIITIGDGSTSGTLQFENDVKTRKVVLYQGADNDNEFYGFGIENSTLVYSVYTTADDHVFFAGTSASTRNELMRIGGDGKVGIGSATPEEKLTIDGTSSGAYIRISNAASGDISSGFMIYNGSNLDTQIYTNPTFGNTTFLTREALAIRAGGSERMRIDSSGNVGITAAASLRFNGAGDETHAVGYDSVIDGSLLRGQNGIRFITATGGGTERMRITSSGNSFFNYTNSTIETYGSGAYGGKVVIKASGAEGLALLNNSIGGTSQVTLSFVNEFVSNQYNYLGRIIAEPEQSWSGTASTRSSRLTFFTNSAGSIGERMRITSDGNVGIGTTDPKTKLQVNGPIGMKNDATGDPINARLVKAGSTSVLFTIKVGAVGAWRAGHAFLKVSGAQNGLQEHTSAWYHLKLVHYYLSGVTNSGTSNPALIKDSGGDTGSYTLSVTATNNADPQEISINISDANGTTDSMIADIDCSFYQGIKDIY